MRGFLVAFLLWLPPGHLASSWAHRPVQTLPPQGSQLGLLLLCRDPVTTTSLIKEKYVIEVAPYSFRGVVHYFGGKHGVVQADMVL